MSKIRWFTDEAGVEQDAVAQVERTASMPFVTGVAVMPDVHYGKGSTVGTVVATEGAVMPACVGVDIGCGMIAVRTTLSPEDVRPHLQSIREGIERRIPLGIGPYGMNSRILDSALPRVAALETHAERVFGDINYMNQRSKDWRSQLGSLGGGNHFIELCVGRRCATIPTVECKTDYCGGIIGGGYVVDDDPSREEVWVILHSGSRGVGNKTGTFWTKAAQKQAKRLYYDQWLPDPDLAYLVRGTEEYEHYIQELKWCQMFALLNREEMMDRVLTELHHTLSGFRIGSVSVEGERSFMSLEVERINCHHNFVKEYDRKTLITRKGAIEAVVGQRALIPGSMGACSYIVTGKGHPGAYHSAPHGAGRRMSRTKAREQFTVEELTARMKAQGIEARVRSAIVDEHPDAYKDIDAVMYDARDLVEPTHVLTQIINVKGD